jgi:Kdo2-lipid IVA lauroyltransferase/acyltransferase
MKKLRYLFEYIVVLAGARCMQLLPLKTAQACGRWLGRAAYAVGVSRRQALNNLRLAFPERSEAELKKIASEAYAQFGQTTIELTRFPVTTPAELVDCFELVNFEAMEETRRQGRGAVCLSAHLGNWEWLAAVLVAKGIPLTLMIGTQSNPWVDQMFIDYRAKLGLKGLRIKEIRELLRVLKKGDFLAFVNDQDGDKWGIFVEFFSTPASTYTMGDMLASKTGSDVFFGVAVRKPEGGHRLEVIKLPEPPADLPAHLKTAFRMQAYNHELEKAVRRNPEQWLWMHHRFQARPEHRLQDEARRRAEAGEIYLDTRCQVWRDKQTDAVVEIAGWKV